MLLNNSYHANFEYNDGDTDFNSFSVASPSSYTVTGPEELRIITEKIKRPDVHGLYSRVRLNDLLEKQIDQIGTSLILGRAGTGKTAVAVDFAQRYDNVAWFSVEATDLDWETFSKYLIASFERIIPEFAEDMDLSATDDEIDVKVLRILEDIFDRLESYLHDQKCLIVLDDIHNVFDTDWFEPFLNGLLAYQLPAINILLISRSKPTSPLWRMRSKQKLAVIDENLLHFTVDELETLAPLKKVSRSNINKLHQASYGRISKFLELSRRKLP